MIRSRLRSGRADKSVAEWHSSEAGSVGGSPQGILRLFPTSGSTLYREALRTSHGLSCQFACSMRDSVHDIQFPLPRVENTLFSTGRFFGRKLFLLRNGASLSYSISHNVNIH